MKKVLSLVLVLTLVLGSFAFAAPQDVVGTEYEDAVARLEQLKVLEGYPDGTFKPANTITRAEFAAVVVRAKGLDSAAQAAKGTTVFTDVPATNWASGYVNIASKMNFVKGMGDGTFAPNSPVTYEQAVTMVIRALGYEPAAEARGGYPYGYLIVANENGLLDAVKGVQGLPAPRGLVAQLVDNALEIPQMIQVGYGAQTKWVVSGTEDTDERLLLDDLGFTKIARERVTEINPDKNQIRLEKAGWKKVVEGFDFEEVHGLRLNAWLDGSGKVTVFTKVDAPKYDAVTKGEKLTLVGENKKYVVANKATLLLNDEEVEAADFQADYAKIVLNSDDEIVWAKGYTLDGFIVVNEVEEEVVYSYDSDELDIEDFTVIKDGKTITLEDLEEGDILFFNKAEAFAVVYNNSKTGELERVYDEQFKFAGKVYSINENAKYLDGNKIGQLKADELDAMVEEDKEVEVFFNLRGVAILVVGNRGEVPTNSFYGRVTAKTVGYTGRSGAMWSLDVRNEEAKVVNFDLTDKFVKNTGITDPKKNTYVGGIAGWATDIDVDAMVRITLDADGKPTKVELLDLLNLHKDFKIAATYAKTGTTDANAVDYRLESSTLVYEGKKVTKLGDAEGVFSVVKAGSKVYVENGRVKLVIGTTDADSDTTAYTGLVAKVRKLTSGAYEFTIKVAGETKVLLTDSTSLTVDKDDYEDEIVTVKVGNKSGKMVTFKDASDATVIADVVAGTSETVRVISTSNRTITTDTVVGSVYKVYELNAKAKLYDAEDSYAELQLRDLVKGDVITIYTDASSDRFVNYIIRTDAFDGTTPAPTQGAKFEGAFEVRGNTWVTIAGKDYIYAGPKTATQLNTQFAINDLVNFTLRTVDNETVVIDIVPAPGGPQVPVVNKTALNQKIAEAEALQEEDYTVETWTSFTVALWNAKTVASRLFATQEEVNNALANLTAKMEALEEKPVVVDKTALNEKIVAAELLDIADYTEATWGPFATALANAKLVAAHSDATQQEVNNALAELIAKMAALIEKPQVTVYTVADLEGEVNKDEAGVWEVIILGTKARVAFPELTASDELLITLADGRSYELDYIQFADEYINLNIQDANLSVEVLESAVVTVLMPR